MHRITRRHFLQLAGSGLLVAHSPYLLAQPEKENRGGAVRVGQLQHKFTRPCLTGH